MSRKSKDTPKPFFQLLLWGCAGTLSGFLLGYIFTANEHPLWLLLGIIVVCLCLAYYSLVVYYTLYPDKKRSYYQKVLQQAKNGKPADIPSRMRSMGGWIFIGFSIPFLIGLPILISLQSFSAEGAEAMMKSVNNIFEILGIPVTDSVYIAVAFLMTWLTLGFGLITCEFLLLQRHFQNKT